jgi:CPA2 family monovalent cation:H+ antiporter-2
VAVAAITTLLTPYLIKSPMDSRIKLSRILPSRVKQVGSAYTVWLQSIQPQGDNVILAKMIRRIIIHALVNFALVIAIFLMSAHFAHVLEKYLPVLVLSEGLEKAVIWSGALLLSLPFLIAAYRKLKALSMLLAEMSVSPERAGQYTMPVRKMISEVIPIVGFDYFIIGLGIKCQYFTASKMVVDCDFVLCFVNSFVMGTICQATFALTNCLD